MTNSMRHFKRLGWSTLLLGLTVIGQALAAPANPLDSPLAAGKFGQAGDFTAGKLTLDIFLGKTMGRLPAVFEFWCKINSTATHNILLAAAPKSGAHWEVYAAPGDGALCVYIPQMGGDFRGSFALAPGQWHFIALTMQPNGFALFADGKPVLERTQKAALLFDQSPLRVGGIQGEGLGLDGCIDDLKIAVPRPPRAQAGVVPSTSASADADTLALFDFDQSENGQLRNRAVGNAALAFSVATPFSLPKGTRFLDEAMDEVYAKSSLWGDLSVEQEYWLPVTSVEAKPATAPGGARPQVYSLNGEWLMKESAPREVDNVLIQWKESEGATKGWWKEGFDRSDWRRVQVPTSVQNALIKLGELKDPFWDGNTYDEVTKYGEPKQNPAWHVRRTRIEQKDWWFARKFTLPAEMKGQALRLYCDGIDYAGSFYLNGQPLGYHAGMFGGPSYDISRLVRHDAPNELVVRIDRAPDMWLGILKGSPGFGWHYGHLISLGIWRDVEIQAVPAVEIDSPFVKTASIDSGKAILQIEYLVRNHGPKPVDLDVTGAIAGKNCRVEAVSFSNRTLVPTGISRFTTEVELKAPKLWWPMNYGEQNLYELTLSAKSADAPGAVQAKPVPFGVRTLEMKPLRGAKAETDYRWQFVINGVPMFIKGANWCWSDPMLQCDPKKYEHILELARRGGIQMFRAWGGGIIETDTFYRLCDEKGLMVYQEFPFCWGPPDFPITNAQSTDQQVTAVVKRLRNHPSLVMWGGGNENVEIKGADEGLTLVGRRCRQFDPTRPFHRTDPWGGNGHNWSVFHNGAPIDKDFVNTPSPFWGEYGLPSMTNWESCLKYLPERKMNTWPPKQDDGALRIHINQWSFGDLIKVMRYCDYGPINDWKTYIEFSQMAQGDEISFAGNLQRAGSYLNKGGFWFYKMTDLFPGHAWAVVDFYGAPKLSYYRAKQTCQPQAAFAFCEKYDWVPGETFRAAIHVGNDSAKPLAGAKVEAVIYGSDLKPLWSRHYEVETLGTSQQRKLDDIRVDLDPQRIKPFLLAVSLRGADGKLINDQWSWFNFRAKTEAMKKMEAIPAWGWPHERAPEGFKAYGENPEARLLRMPQTTLAVVVKRKGAKGEIVIRNKTDRPAFNVLIEGFPYEYGNYLADNSFCLHPNEKRSIAFDLADQKARLDNIAVRAWNAPSAQP